MIWTTFIFRLPGYDVRRVLLGTGGGGGQGVSHVLNKHLLVGVNELGGGGSMTRQAVACSSGVPSLGVNRGILHIL